MSAVRFYTGAENLYTEGYAQGQYVGGIFFASDTYTIWKDGKMYGSISESNVTQEWINNKFGGAFVSVEEDYENGSYIFTFQDVNGTASYNIVLPVATATKSGLLSAEDKAKLDDLNADNIVQKEDGKGLSTNDYTNEDKEKLAGIEDSAQENKIEVIQLDGVTLPITNKTVDIPLSEKITEIVDGKISQAYVYKGSVDSADALPESGDIGDVYNIVNQSIYGPAGVNVAWNGTEWDSLGGILSTLNVDQEISALKSSVSEIVSRVETLEELDVSDRLSAAENAITVLNSDVNTEGSVSNTASNVAYTVVNEQLTWIEL